MMNHKPVFSAILSLLLCCTVCAETWKLKNVRGKSAVFADGKVVQKSNTGEFVLTGKQGFKVKGGVEYILDFECKIENINGAYVNFYLQAFDAKGKPKQTVAYGGSPGVRGFNRDRMSRLEIPSAHFLKHRMRFKAGNKSVRMVPVFESSDGAITLVPGKITLTEKLKRPDVVETVSASQLKKTSGKIVMQSVNLMPEVEYSFESDQNIPAGAYELHFISDFGKTLSKIAITGKKVNFKVPEETVKTLLVRTGAAKPFSAKIKKEFKVDFQRGVYENEWQGTELVRGEAQGKLVCFRRKFVISGKPEFAAVRFLGHNSAELFVNGTSCGAGGQFNPGKAEITKLLKPGENVLAIECKNRNGVLRVLFDAYVADSSGKKQLIVSDGETKYSLKAPAKTWMLPGYDDSAWLPAVTGGSPKDFGDSIIAARVNNRHERLYIGPVRNISGVTAEIPATAAVGEAFTLKLAGTDVKLPETGRLYFRSGSKYYDCLLKGDGTKYQAVPEYAVAGKYSVFAKFERYHFDGKAELPLGEIEITAAKNRKLPEFEVKRVNGKSLLARDGKIIPTAFYCHGQEQSIEIQRVNDKAGIKFHMFWISDLERNKDGKFDLTSAEAAIRNTLRQIEHDPEAHIVVCTSFTPAKKFAKRAKYQDELTLTSRGEKLRISHQPGERKYGTPYKDFSEANPHGFSSVSHASQLKIKEYCDAIKALIKHFENTPFASKIAGYGFSGEMDGQWHLYAPYSGSGASLGMVDYSPVMLDFFRRHLRKKYKTEAALQQAWQAPGVTFDNALIPGYEDRVGNKFFVSQPATDYAEAYALAESELISALSKAAKDELKRKALVWIYTKDSYRDVGLNQFLPHVLNSGSGFEQYTTPYFDACGNPTDYYFRQNGLHPANRGAHASAHLNKKIKLLEMDLRSYLTQAQQKVWGGDTAIATMNHFRNVLMEGFQYGSSYRFYSFWLGWYNNAGIHNVIRRMGEIEKIQLTLPERWKKRVCQFYDDRAITHVGNFDDRGIRMRHYYFAKALTGVGANTLNRSGVGFETYYLRDLLNPDFPADQFDVFIFNSCFQFNDELLAAVNTKLRKQGKVLIFPWGNGFLNRRHKVDAAAVQELTGVKVERNSITADNGAIKVDNKAHKLLAHIKPGTQIAARHRYNITPELPMFKVADKDAAIGGKFGDGSPALAIKKVGDSYSVVMFTPDYSGELLRSICKTKNIHVYSDNEYDFVMTDGNFLGIHSGVGGVKRIPLPEKVSKAVDFFTGEVVASDVSELKVPLEDDETRILKLEF